MSWPLRGGVAALALVLSGCASKPATRSVPPGPSPAPVATAEDPRPPAPSSEARADTFAVSVRPILERRCTPCHVPGGRMYDRLPFDNPDVVRSHLDGILRRLKDDAERGAVTSWAASSSGS
ncbi:MAG: hypothetical protein A2V74_09325 [Acidobacteria bacterium RBG_16_70_10]|nr:MAG: hypothetical protein A2V74_09325 [Acidobacteria bacterium RBG_16_70_10]